MQIGKISLSAGRIGGLVVLLAVFGATIPTIAQVAPAAPAQVAPEAPAQVTPTDPPKAEAPRNTPAAAPAEEGDIQTVEIASRVVIQIHGSASWEEGYRKIWEALGKLRASAEKAGLKVDGRPLAVFTETDDAGFKFDALLPVDAKADAKLDLGADISLAQSPSGKALKFQHRGAYDDIDTTYDAITAYLDEKGLEARNLFVEEYLNDAKDSSDVALEVDIFVFVK